MWIEHLAKEVRLRTAAGLSEWLRTSLEKRSQVFPVFEQARDSALDFLDAERSVVRPRSAIGDEVYDFIAYGSMVSDASCHWLGFHHRL